MKQIAKKFSTNQKLALTAVSLCLVSGGSTAAVIEEVLVMAQKRAQSTQDIGGTVNALSSQDVKQLRIIEPIDVGNSLTSAHPETFNPLKYKEIFSKGIKKSS